MEISKIVITGGPCAGKSTAMSWVQKAFSQTNHIRLKLDVISVFNVKMTVMYNIYLDSPKDVSANPDREKISDLSTYIVHHTNYTIEEKSILSNNL